MVNWRTLTKPKKASRLGICESRQAKIAIIRKIEGQLAAGVNKMWTPVFNAKYVKESNVLDCEP